VTTKRKIPQSALIAGLVGGFVLIALLGYFILISPQRSKAADLQKQIDNTEHLISETRALTLQRKNAPKIRVADIYRVTKAMPDQADMAGIVLELNRVATDTGITFDSIEPQSAAVLSDYQAVPIQLVFDGNFYDLSDFLYRLRNLVDVRRGALDATGRLFAIDQLSFDEGDEGFPRIRATLVVDAFVYGTQAPATAAPEPSATTTAGSTTTAGTGTTATTGTTPSGTSTTTPTTTATTPATQPSLPPAGSASAAGASTP
jgi:Pilus assembly protein, PilO